MRSTFDTYDRYLELQTDISFGAELSFFYRRPFLDAQTVIDLGCGNASYLRRLAEQFPQKQFLGVDIDSDILDRARSRRMPENVRLFCGELPEVAEPVDVLYSRLCTIYIADLQPTTEWIRRNVRLGVVDIGPADHLKWLPPDLPLFQKVLKGLDRLSKRTGGSRNVSETLRSMLEERGFQHEWQHDVVVTSEPPFSREKFYHFKVLTAERLLGSALSAELHNELFEWFLAGRRSYSQYAHHANCYVRHSNAGAGREM